jgi:triosephosphate isomerase
MKKIIIFNWEMNVADFIRMDKNNEIEIVICPPFTHLEKIKNSLSSKIKLGAQNCFYENEGAYTGEISPKMLKNLGVEYVVIGHSERRRYLNETDEMINKKVLAALKTGLKVVLCVGEETRNRLNDSRMKSNETRMAKNYVKKQLEKDLKGLSKIKNQKSKVIVAYEPVWAISTSKNGKSDTPKDALEMIKFIKQFLTSHFSLFTSPLVLYGGSVDSKNIFKFLKHPAIDGAFVGGASLKAKEVERILDIVSGLIKK